MTSKVTRNFEEERGFLTKLITKLLLKFVIINCE